VIVVDSSVWIDYFRTRDTAATRFLRTMQYEGDILVGDVILLEILQGAQNDRHANFLETRLRQFAIQPMLNPGLAVASARNYRTLRERGLTVRKTIDLVIGTFCIEHGHGLLHQDRDFEPMRQHLGLSVVSV
jgi:predicted nucleic acid-binding protein